jgi:hypothetical protein
MLSHMHAGSDQATDQAPLIKGKLLSITPVVIRPPSNSLPWDPMAVNGSHANGIKHAALEEQEGTGQGGREAKRARLETEPEAMDVQGSQVGGLAGAGDAAAATNGGTATQQPQQQQQAVDPDTQAPRPWPGTGTDARQVAESVCYVCELAGMPGKFDPKTAAALGVPKGPVSLLKKNDDAVTAAAPAAAVMDCVWD